MKVYGTLWTHYVVHGASIDFQDVGGRPYFRADAVQHTHNSRFFDGMTQTKLER